MPSSSRVLKAENLGVSSSFDVESLDEKLAPANQPLDSAFSSGLPDFSAIPDDTVKKKGGISTLSEDHRFAPGRSSILLKEKMRVEPKVWSFPDLSRKAAATPVNQRISEPQKVEDHSYLIEEAKERADEIIAQADQNATDILSQAQAEAENLKQKAFMEGMTAARTEVSQSMHQVERIVQETQIWQEQVMHQSQNKIIDMVLSIGRKMFGNGFELPPEQIDRIVSRAINEASRLGNLRIYLNPEDAKALVNLWQESELTLNGQQIQIVSSQNISRGGCFVDGQFGVVDGRVEEQMDQIVDSLHLTEVNLEKEADNESDHEPEQGEEEEEG